MPLIRHFAFVLCLFSLLLVAYAQAEGGDIRVQTFPILAKVRPLSDAVRIVLTVLEGDRKATGRGWLKIRLYAPAPGWLFSTDFPLVEGSRLVEMELPVTHGSVEWEYVFPIRGIYRLEVSTIDKGRKEVREVFKLGIREKRRKLFILGSFIAALFLFGVLVGRRFTDGSREP